MMFSLFGGRLRVWVLEPSIVYVDDTAANTITTAAMLAYYPSVKRRAAR